MGAALRILAISFLLIGLSFYLRKKSNDYFRKATEEDS